MSIQQNELSIPLDQRDGVIWHNGLFLAFKEAKVHILTQSLHYASSVYEGCRIYNGKVFKLQEHIERLLLSAEILKLRVQYSVEDLIFATNQLVAKNNLTFGYVRPLIWRGSKSLKIGALDNTTEAMIAAWEIAENHFHSQKSLNLSVSRWVKPEANVIPAQCKSAGHYTMLIVSKYEAIEAGFDDAVIMGSDGFIAECSTSNIFFVKNKKLYTPTIKYALNGLTRQSVISIAQENSIDVEECDLKPQDLFDFEEAFITGTAAEIQKIASITYNETKKQFVKFEIGDLFAKLYSLKVNKL